MKNESHERRIVTKRKLDKTKHEKIGKGLGGEGSRSRKRKWIKKWSGEKEKVVEKEEKETEKEGGGG